MTKNKIPNPKKYSKVLNSFYLDTSDESDNYVQKECREKGQWEPLVTVWMMKNIKKDWVCLDIGANIFYYTEVLARLVGTKGKVISFEPLPFLVEKYKKAQKYNEYSNSAPIEIKNYALSDKKQKFNMLVPKVNIGGSNIIFNNTVRMYDGGYHLQEIDSTDLASIYSGHIDFMKIDIEGHEPIAWQGFSESAKNCPLILLELSNQHPKDFIDFIFREYHVSDILERKLTKKDFYKTTKHNSEIVHMDLVLRKKNL